MKRKRSSNRYLDSLTDCKKKCRCGHTQVVYPEREFVLCEWCGARLYYDDSKQEKHNEKCLREEFRVNLYKALDK